MRPRRDRARGGFTLAEVLASLALVGAILPGAMAGVTLAMEAGSTARLRRDAAELARGVLDEVIATEAWREGNSEGGFGDEWPRFTWRVETADWDEPLVKEVKVVVEWTRRERERAVTMATLVYAGEG